MALEPVPSMSPLVVLAHDDPGTADSLRHAVQSATGWQVMMADPSPAGLAAALATGPSVALVGCAALPASRRTAGPRSSPSATTTARPTSEPLSPPVPAACSPGPTGPPTSQESWRGSPSSASPAPAPATPAWSSPPEASRVAPAPPRSPSTWPPPGPAGVPPRSCFSTSPEASPSASTSAPSQPGPPSRRSPGRRWTRLMGVRGRCLGRCLRRWWAPLIRSMGRNRSRS